jgi:hypothetical protein
MEPSSWPATGPDSQQLHASAEQEVAAEIRALERLKPRLMQPDDGRDLLSVVNAQLRVLNEGIDEQQVLEIWGEIDECLNPTWYIAKGASAASRWMLRPWDRARLKAPSVEWQPYLIERRRTGRSEQPQP